MNKDHAFMLIQAMIDEEYDRCWNRGRRSLEDLLRHEPSDKLNDLMSLQRDMMMFDDDEEERELPF